jgi:hypothetical protein
MKKIFIPFFLLFFTGVVAQKKHGINSHRIINDSTAKKIIEFRDSILQRIQDSDSIKIRAGENRNFQEIINLQKRNRQAQKSGAILRIGIGIALLIVLIIGLNRKRTKKHE